MRHYSPAMQGELVKEVAILRDRLATQEAGLAVERESTTAQIRGLTMKNAELSAAVSEMKRGGGSVATLNLNNLFGTMF